MGPLGPLKKSLRSGPKGPLGPLGPLKKSLRSGIHARNPPKWSATHLISCPELPKMGGEAAHFGFFRGRGSIHLHRSPFFLDREVQIVSASVAIGEKIRRSPMAWGSDAPEYSWVVQRGGKVKIFCLQRGARRRQPPGVCSMILSSTGL